MVRRRVRVSIRGLNRSVVVRRRVGGSRFKGRGSIQVYIRVYKLLVNYTKT